MVSLPYVRTPQADEFTASRGGKHPTRARRPRSPIWCRLTDGPEPNGWPCECSYKTTGGREFETVAACCFGDSIRRARSVFLGQSGRTKKRIQGDQHGGNNPKPHHQQSVVEAMAMDPHGTDGVASPRCFLERDWLLAASPLGSSDIAGN